jgi:formate hydrogenlyase subunit 4
MTDPLAGGLSPVRIAAPLLALALAPLMLGVINRTKALFAGRNGPPLLQTYFDLWKLLRKGAVYSRTTTWIFRAGPIVGVAAPAAVLLILPLGGERALVAFPGDIFLLAYLLAAVRFFIIAAALDTGSAFEGMGASREAQFSALAEPALLLGLAALGRLGGAWSLSDIYRDLTPGQWAVNGPALALVAAALAVVFLAENARIPVDDPNTHLELTMIHEVMVLDHGGPDFAFVLYGVSLKLWVLGVLVVGLVVPCRAPSPWLNLAAAVAGLLALSVVVGVVESCMARLRLLRVPQLLTVAAVFAALAVILLRR